MLCMSPSCNFCDSTNLDVTIEYGVKISDDDVEERELGTVNAVCMECNREQYLTKGDLPRDLVAPLLN